MYALPRRQEVDYGAVGPDNRIRVDAHHGTAADFLCRYREEAAIVHTRSEQECTAFLNKIFDRTTDTRNLYEAFRHLQRFGGTAPGPDGWECTDLDTREIRTLCKLLSKSIRDGNYFPGQERSVKILKSSGLGYRTIRIQNLMDRLVQRSIVQTLEPWLDPMFDRHSFGFRRSHTREQALAHALKHAEAENRWIWVCEDLKNAFDTVPLGRLKNLIKTSNKQFDDLIDKVLNHPQQGKYAPTKRGIRQGGALSPLLLNVYLNHYLDKPWRTKQPERPMIRWADDLLILCKDRSEAQDAYQQLREMLIPTGMSLKGNADTTIHDLANGQGTEWLGWDIRRQEKPTIGIAKKGWKQFRSQMEDTHNHNHSVLRARQIINGWTSQIGPAWKDNKYLIVSRTVQMMQELDLGEAMTNAELRARSTKSEQRWIQTLQEDMHCL